MAHQAHNIPWTYLSSHLHFVYQKRSDSDRTNFYFVKGRDRQQQLTFFANKFEKTVIEFARTERQKYPREFALPDSLDEEALPQSTVDKIQSTFREAREDDLYWTAACSGPINDHERSWRYWTTYDEYRDPCNCGASSHSMGRCPGLSELVSAMLLHDEMRTLLRIASHPENVLRMRWDGHCYRGGWRAVAKAALKSYIVLNTIYLRPETYDRDFAPQNRGRDGTHASQRPSPATGIDYRLTWAYRQAQVASTASSDSVSAALQPHRIFFGLAKFDIGRFQFDFGHIFTNWTEYRNRTFRLNEQPIEPTGRWNDYDRATGRLVGQVFQPTWKECESVVNILGYLGLPVELSVHIMDKAGYQPPAYTRLPIPYDPLHPKNREELLKYLSSCWKLIYRSELLASSCGVKINWAQEVSQCIVELFCRRSDIGKVYMPFKCLNPYHDRGFIYAYSFMELQKDNTIDPANDQFSPVACRILRCDEHDSDYHGL